MNQKELAQMLKDAGIESCVGFMNINPTEWVYTHISYSPDGEVEEFSMEKSFGDNIAACINYTHGKVGGAWYGDAIANGVQSSHCDDDNSTFDNLADAIAAATEAAEMEAESMEDIGLM